MAADEEDDDFQSVASGFPRSAHLFLAVHAQSEFDEDEEIEGRLGSTMYFALRGSSSTQYKNNDEEPKYLAPVPAETLAPLLSAMHQHDPLVFRCMLPMRIITGERPVKEGKAWNKRRTESLRTAALEFLPRDVSLGDPALFLEAAFAEGTIHGGLTAALLLLHFPPSQVLKLGPLSSTALNVPHMMPTPFTTCDYLLCKVLKRACEAASDFAARRALGEKPDIPPARGIKSHPMTFVLFAALLGAFERRIHALAGESMSKDLNDALMFAARTLGINLWYLELGIKAPLMGLGTPADAGDLPHTTLAAQSNALGLAQRLNTHLLSLLRRLRGLDHSDSNRGGLEECAFAWGAGLLLFYPQPPDREALLKELLAVPMESGEGNHLALEVLCGRLSFMPAQAKRLSARETIDALLASIQRTWSSSADSARFQQQEERQIAKQVDPQAPLSPASSTGGASVYSIVSGRNKRGEDEDDEPDEGPADELASVLGQTKARSIGTNSVASSLIAVAGDEDAEMPSLVSAMRHQKSSVKSISLDVSSVVELGGNGAPTLTRPAVLRHFQRTRLLWFYQGLCMVQQPSTTALSSVSSSAAQPLVLDEPRCAETIQVMLEGRRAVQKADKKWGTAISSMAMNLSIAEVFQWRIKVDKCEDGHVFFGVATRDASSSTYLGEDAHGWGFIGKAHLWHNREKRGAFGEPIRTGDIVTVTLDCRKGTLSIANSSKDFGVAFKGLKEYCQGEACLYPAIALYERGDTVTLLPASVPGDESNPLDLGVTRGLFWSLNESAAVLEKAMSSLDRSLVALTFPPPDDYLSHLEVILGRIASVQTLEQCAPLLATVATFCLWPNNRITPKTALRLISPTLLALDRASSLQNRSEVRQMTGKWWFYDSSSSRHVAELSQEGGVLKGTLLSKREGAVKVLGTVKDWRVVLAEQWKQATRFVKLRLMPDSRVAIGHHQFETKPSSSASPIKPMIAVRIQGSEHGSGSSFASKAINLLCSLLGKLSYALTSAQDDDASSDKESSDSQTTEQKWACSELFAGHASDAHSSSMEALSDRIRTDPALAGLLGEGTLTMLRTLAVLVETSPQTQSVVKEDDDQVQQRKDFLSRFESGECADLDHWMLRFAGQAALVAKGGPSIAQVRRSAIASFLLHSDIVDEARFIDRFFETKKSLALSSSAPSQQQDVTSETTPSTVVTEDGEELALPAEEETSKDETLETEAAPHPSVMLIDVWRAGTRVVTWAIREKQQQGVSYDVVGEPLLNKARMLQELSPTGKTRLEYDVPPPRPSNARPSPTEAVLRALDEWKRSMRNQALSSSTAARSHADALEPVVAFFTDRTVNVQDLKQVFASRAFKALLRVAGFCTARRALDVLGKYGIGGGAISCIVQWLPSSPSICAQVPPLESEPASSMIDFTSVSALAQQMPVLTALDLEDLGLVASATSLMRPVASERASCRFGLDGCGRLASRLVQNSFEELFVLLSSHLNKSDSTDDTMSAIEAWTLPLKEESDFQLIVRVGLLHKLKAVLDDCRAETRRDDDDEEAALPDSVRLLTRSKQAILVSCLRLVGCLAHQIITDALPNRSDPPSKRELINLIFEMALLELREVCTRLEKRRELGQEPSLNDEAYCFQLLQLLFSVSVTGPSTSRRFLCTGEWVQLLLRASRASESPRIQQRSFRLIGRILPYVSDHEKLHATVILALLGRIKLGFRAEEADVRIPAITRSGFATRMTAVAESISLIRKMLTPGSSWFPVAQHTIQTYLMMKASEDFGHVWAALAVLGGFYEPLRLLGLVRFTSASTQEFETFLANTSLGKSNPVGGATSPSTALSLGVTVALQESKCHIVLPALFAPSASSLSQNDDADEGSAAGGDDRIRLMGSSSTSSGASKQSSGGGGKPSKLMSGVVCERSDIVPVSDAQVPMRVLQDLAPRLLQLFDEFVLDQGEEEAKNQSADAEQASPEQRRALIHRKADRATLKSALVKLIPVLVTMPLFSESPSSRLTKLLELGCRATDSMGLSDAHLVSSWWRALHESMSVRPSKDQPAIVAPQHQPAQTHEIRAGTPAPANSTSPPSVQASATPDPFAMVDDATLLVLQDMLALDLGFSRELCIISLERCGNDIEAAVHFCLEHARDAEVLVEEFRQTRRALAAAAAATNGASGAGGGGGNAANRQPDGEQRRRLVIIERLKDMGFPQTWCVKALEATGNEGFNQALTWLLSNGDSLAEQDEVAERLAKEQEELRAKLGRQEVAPPQALLGRLVCTSGGIVTTHISPELHVSVRGSASSNGGFPSVMAEGVLVFKGRWYFEVTIETDNCMQIGWGDACYTGDASEGTGVGDDAHSWAYDGYRKLKWHQQSVSWGKQWKIGDVIGCAADLDAGELWFSLNGVWEDGMGLAFRGLIRGLHYVGGLAPAASFNKAERMRFNFGPVFKHSTGPAKWAEKPARALGEAFTDEENNLKLMRTSRVKDMPESLKEAFAEVDDCFEESIGDALSDRYFSHGQFGSTSLLARRSSSGASGPTGGGSGGASSSAHASAGIFAVKDPYPRACALSVAVSSLQAATDELFRLDPGLDGDDTLCAAMERTSDMLTTLYARAACLLLLAAPRPNAFSSEVWKSNVALVCRLAKTCSGKMRLLDVLSAVDLTLAKSPETEEHPLLQGLDPRMDALEALSSSQAMRRLLETSDEARTSIFAYFARELSLASTRQYAYVPWDESELALPLVVHSLWSLAMDDASVRMSEMKILEHPSMKLTCWLGRILRESGDEDMVNGLVLAWAHALRSPGTRMKIVAARELVSFLSEDGDYEKDARLNNAIASVIKPRRIRDAAQRIMQRSGTCSMHSVPSKYGSALIELASLLGI